MAGEITIWYVEEHEPDSDEFPVMVVGHAWTEEDAIALAEARRDAVETERPGLVVADDDSEGDIWWEVQCGSLPVAGCPKEVRVELCCG